MMIHIDQAKAQGFKQAPCRTHKKRNAVGVVRSVGFHGDVALCQECLNTFAERPIHLKLHTCGSRSCHIMRQRQSAIGGWTGWRYALVFDDAGDLAYQWAQRMDEIGAP